MEDTTCGSSSQAAKNLNILGSADDGESAVVSRAQFCNHVSVASQRRTDEKSMARSDDAAPVEIGQLTLMRWGRSVRRDLPWRLTRNPWHVLVSEVMAQQTQVARVVPKWEHFVQRWPTPAVCARAELGDILELWAGLGYPRRARSLWQAAKQIVGEFGGEIPNDVAQLQQLAGVGPYTARAVCVFAFEADVGVVDTNIARVLARQHGRSLSASEAQALADAWVNPGTGWEHNQSLMDLGAMLCRPVPDCMQCPIRPSCAWGSGDLHNGSASGPKRGVDPAVGSAGVSTRQASFVGSRRQARGLVMRMARDAMTRAMAVAALESKSLDPEVIDELIAEQLVHVDAAGHLGLGLVR